MEQLTLCKLCQNCHRLYPVSIPPFPQMQTSHHTYAVLLGIERFWIYNTTHHAAAACHCVGILFPGGRGRQWRTRNTRVLWLCSGEAWSPAGDIPKLYWQGCDVAETGCYSRGRRSQAKPLLLLGMNRSSVRSTARTIMHTGKRTVGSVVSFVSQKRRAEPFEVVNVVMVGSTQQVGADSK